MKPLIKTKVIKTWNDDYPKMEGNSPFAKRFNELQSNAWVSTGEYLPIEDLIIQILIENYNVRLSELGM
jgi:hypothetical protein